MHVKNVLNVYKDSVQTVYMRFSCLECLTKKISSYCLESKDLSVKVIRRTDLDKCQLCGRQAYFEVSYVPKNLDVKSMIG